MKYEGNILKDQLCKARREDKSNRRPAGLTAMRSTRRDEPKVSLETDSAVDAMGMNQTAGKYLLKRM